MATMTLLEMVRNILSALEEEDVDNVDDTPSSFQVAEILKEVYFQFVQNDEVPELNTLFRLDAAPAGENSILTLPTTIAEVFWIKYNRVIAGDTRQDWRIIEYLTPDEFINLTDRRNSTLSEVEQVTDPSSTSVTILIENDKGPEYWTSFDDKHIFFDSYDIAADASGLVNTKTKCYGRKNPVWTATNAFVPILDANKFPFLLAEAKAVAFANLKQTENPKIERIARQQKAKQLNNIHRVKRPNFRIRQPTFGRRSHNSNHDYGRRR